MLLRLFTLCSLQSKGLLSVTFGSLRAFTRNKTTMLGQQTLQVSSTWISYFGLATQKEQGSSRNCSQGRSSVAQKIKKTLAPLNLSNSKKSFANYTYKSANLSFTHASHDMYPLKIYLQDDLFYFPMSQMINKAIVIDDSTVEAHIQTGLR